MASFFIIIQYAIIFATFALCHGTLSYLQIGLNLVIFAFCSTNLSYIYIYLKLSQNHILTQIFLQNCILPQIFLKLQESLPTFQNPLVQCLVPCICDAFNMFMRIPLYVVDIMLLFALFHSVLCLMLVCLHVINGAHIRL